MLQKVLDKLKVFRTLAVLNKNNIMAEQVEIKRGNVIKLNSDNRVSKQLMTVNTVKRDINDLEFAECLWFDKQGVLNSGSFYLTSLIKVS